MQKSFFGTKCEEHVNMNLSPIFSATLQLGIGQRVPRSDRLRGRFSQKYNDYYYVQTLIILLIGTAIFDH